MKPLNVSPKWMLMAGATTALIAGLAVGCQSTTPPSNLSLSDQDAQKIEADRIEKTNQAHQVVLNIRDALTPVEGVLKDLSNFASRVDAKVGGKSVDNLHLSDGFALIDTMLEKTYRSGMAGSNNNGAWSITQSIPLKGSIHIGNCESVNAESSGTRSGDHDSMQLTMVDCNSQRTLLADIQVDQDTISAGLHLENLKDISISSPSHGAACSLSIGVRSGVLDSDVNCQPIYIKLGSNRINIDPLELNVDMKGDLRGRIGVRGTDGAGNEFFSVHYPRVSGDYPMPTASASPAPSVSSSPVISASPAPSVSPSAAVIADDDQSDALKNPNYP